MELCCVSSSAAVYGSYFMYLLLHGSSLSPSFVACVCSSYLTRALEANWWAAHHLSAFGEVSSQSVCAEGTGTIEEVWFYIALRAKL